MIDRARAEAAFYDYASHYDADDILIRHKIEHTLRVAENCERIALSLGLDGGEVSFAWFLGLLHDIGRFEQVKRYGTFIDAVSVDHAEFGADLLFRDGLLAAFPAETLTPAWLGVLETAIRLHNKLSLPEDQDARTRRFCELIRDADKLDIFRVVSELSFEQRIGSSRGLIVEGDEASEAVMDCVRAHRCVPSALRKTRFEGHVAHCCMAFELVFPESRRMVREQGWLDRLLDERGGDGEALWTEKQRAQMQILREELDKALKQEEQT